jgi:hypothetical protein
MLALPVFGKVFLRQFTEIGKVEGTVLVDALVNVKMLAILLFGQSVTAVRAYEGYRLKISLFSGEPVLTNFTQQLPTATGIIVKVSMRCSAVEANAIRRNRVLTA